MTWLRLDDGFAEHPKIRGLSGGGAFRFHVTALCYCARNLTDGKLDAQAVKIVGAMSGLQPKRWISELVNAGLWSIDASSINQRDDFGLANPHQELTYTINDFTDYNPTSDRVKKEREQAAERKRRSRHTVTDTVTHGVTPTVTDGVSHRTPARPVLTSSSTEQQPHTNSATLDELLDKLHALPPLRAAAHQDPDRAIVCAQKALAEAKTSPGGFFRRLLEAGTWPAGAPTPKLPPPSDFELVRRQINNGAITDILTLDAEIRASELTAEEADKLRALIPGGRDQHDFWQDEPPTEEATAA